MSGMVCDLTEPVASLFIDSRSSECARGGRGKELDLRWRSSIRLSSLEFSSVLPFRPCFLSEGDAFSLLTVVLTCFIDVFEKSRILDTLGDESTLVSVGLFVREENFETEKSDIDLGKDQVDRD